MIEVSNQEKSKNKPIIKVVGIGGGGNNAVNRMINAGMENVEYIAINTDYQVLEKSLAPMKLQIGKKLTEGMGAGADPAVGAASVRENEDDIIASVSGANIVILTCGLGGGTGTGAIPVIAGICREQKILTIAVVTLPFTFEGTPKQEVAQKGLADLRECTDLLLVIPNDKLLAISKDDFYLEDAFLMADNVLKDTIEGITGIIFGLGMVNLDLNDIHTTVYNSGLGHLGIGTAKKDGSIMDAVKQAINSPLMDTDISTASKILLNTSGRLKTKELEEALSYVREIARPDVCIHWGTVSYNNDDNIVVTILATGLDNDSPQHNFTRGSKEDRQDQLLRRYKGTPKLSGTSEPQRPEETKDIFSSDLGLQIPIFIQKQSMLRNVSAGKK